MCCNYPAQVRETTPANKKAFSLGTMLVPCKATAKNLSDFGLSHIPSSGITLRKNRLHLSKRHRVKCFLPPFLLQQALPFFPFQRQKHRAVEEDIHCWRWVKSIKGYTPPPASSCTLQALLEKHHPEVSKNPKSRLALSTTSVNLNGPN